MTKKYLKDIKSKLSLSLSIANAQFKQKNEGSLLGILWYLLNPLILFVLLFFIFSKRLGEDIPFYPLYLLLGIIMFNFFQGISIRASGVFLKENSFVIKSISFPKQCLVLGLVINFLFSHLFEIFIFLLFLLYFKIPLFGIAPYLILVVFFSMFCYGLGLIIASMVIYIRDLENMWFFVSRLIWFGTPIFYSVEKGTILYNVNLINPLFYYITSGRSLLIHNQIPDVWICVNLVLFSFVFFILGLILYHKLKYRIPEML